MAILPERMFSREVHDGEHAWRFIALRLGIRSRYRVTNSRMNALMISLYIVTYRNPEDLNGTIASVLASGADVRINVINNHSEFFLEPKHEKAVTVLHNTLRPDFSTGHLARNWNQALLHGFRDLTHPASDIVVTVQDDVIFKPDWLPRLIDLHHRYSFITMGGGDAFCSYLPEAVRRIGLWDERFCNIGFQEADYFLRALIYNREGSSINDPIHGRLHNALEGSTFVGFDNFLKYLEAEKADQDPIERSDSILITVPRMNPDRRKAHLSSTRFHRLSGAVFRHKWGVSGIFWTAEHHVIRNSVVPNYITYPYFEKDVEGLREKNYILSDDFISPAAS